MDARHMRPLRGTSANSLEFISAKATSVPKVHQIAVYVLMQLPLGPILHELFSSTSHKYLTPPENLTPPESRHEVHGPCAPVAPLRLFANMWHVVVRHQSGHVNGLLLHGVNPLVDLKSVDRGQV